MSQCRCMSLNVQCSPDAHGECIYCGRGMRIRFTVERIADNEWHVNGSSGDGHSCATEAEAMALVARLAR